MPSKSRVAGALLAAIALAATAAPAAAKPQTLHLHFQRVASGVGAHCGNGVLTSGPYVLASLAKPGTRACPSRFLLLDDSAGKQTVLRPGGYTTVQAFAAPWILFSHNLYNIVTHKWRPLGCSSPKCAPDGTIGVVLGARWLEMIVQGHQSCGDGVHFECGPDTYVYYNLLTHQVRHGSPQTSTRVVDPDSPTLTRRVCAPLRVPASGSLTLEGKVALSSNADGRRILERCGSRLHMPVDVSSSGVPAAAPALSSRAGAELTRRAVGCARSRGRVDPTDQRRLAAEPTALHRHRPGQDQRRHRDRRARHVPRVRRRPARGALGGDAVRRVGVAQRGR